MKYHLDISLWDCPTKLWVHKHSSLYTVFLYTAQHTEGMNGKSQTFVNHIPSNNFPTVWQHCPLQTMILFSSNMNVFPRPLSTTCDSWCFKALDVNKRQAGVTLQYPQQRKHLMRYTTWVISMIPPETKHHHVPYCCWWWNTIENPC